MITFQGQSVEELEQAMAYSGDFYLDWSKDRGREPEIPFSGRLMVRTSQEIQTQAAIAAAKAEVFLSKYVEKATEDEIHQVSTS